METTGKQRVSERSYFSSVIKERDTTEDTSQVFHIYYPHTMQKKKILKPLLICVHSHRCVSVVTVVFHQIQFDLHVMLFVNSVSLYQLTTQSLLRWEQLMCRNIIQNEKHVHRFSEHVFFHYTTESLSVRTDSYLKALLIVHNHEAFIFIFTHRETHFWCRAHLVRWNTVHCLF